MNVPNIFEQNEITNRKERVLMKERIIEHTVNGIKVTSYIPENVSESVKRNRINQIYDILKPHEKEIKEEDEKETKVS